MKKVVEEMNDFCLDKRHGIATPEHLMVALLAQPQFAKVAEHYCSDFSGFIAELSEYMSEQDVIPEDVEEHCVYSQQLMMLFSLATAYYQAASVTEMKVTHIVYAMYELSGAEESMIAYLLNRYMTDKVDFLAALIDMDQTHTVSEPFQAASGTTATASQTKARVINAEEMLANRHPMVGRKAEMEQLVQVLCRKDRHHVMLVGEIGVGKSTLAYELARRMVSGLLPVRFGESRLFILNLKSLMEGVQFRADLERRVSETLQSVSDQGNSVVYIEDMHLLGAFAKQGDEVDFSALLKPYLDWDNLRFVGACTPKDFSRYFSNQKRFETYFQKIDVEEPSVEDAIKILQTVIPEYADYHKVSYENQAVEYAVTATSKHIHNQFLPQKAISLLDDAGAYLVSHPEASSGALVDVALVSKLLAKVCKSETLLTEGDGEERLATLESRILSKIYGQDDAVRLVVENVQMGKAGLLDDHKPLASFLFVGPTGVGKTEVANVLAKELGVELVRFDMSEYVEQYTVSKLIGSPAGYVGYDEGGLLTEAIRKNPNCVLLLDEIEKAHADIYNILLQVMDYARLTDNKGNHADFRNVILIMTSNAGAQYASHASVGFGSSTKAGDVMAKQVKKTFKPEFLNRLTASVVFNEMDRTMAERVLDKKLGLLQQKLSARQVEMHFSEEVRRRLLDGGFSREYGAREMDRVIAQQLKPLLTKEILFGKLKNGGIANVGLQDDKLVLL